MASLTVLPGTAKPTQADSSTQAEGDMIEYHFSLGMWIRNNFGLWGEDSKPRKVLGPAHPDDASGVLINKYWHSLQSTK